MGAAALILLILLMIGLGVAFYYTVLCLQARPNKRKQFSTSDRGHLLANDPDLNGNVEEEIPVDTVDSSPNNADPKLDDDSMDDSTAKESEMESLLLKSMAFQVTPQCASKDPKTVFIHIEDEPSPNETDSIRHISPINLSLASKYCNTSNLNEFLPQDNNCPGTLSDSFEEDGLMVSRKPANATSISQKVNESELNATLPSEGDSYYDISKEKNQVHIVTQNSNPNSSESEAAANILFENEKIPIVLSLQSSKVLDKIVPNKISANGEEPLPVDPLPSDTVDSIDHPQADDMSSNNPPYPISPSHPYVNLHSPEELPKSEDYVIINPIYAQMQESNSDESFSKVESHVESGPLGWHIPISERLSYNETLSNVESKDVADSTPHKISAELAENSNLEAPSIKDEGSKQGDAINCDNKPMVVKVLFHSDENISGSPSPFFDKYSPSKDAESSTDSSSEPDVTEYSFITGPKVPSTALVLADEVSFYSDPKVTSFVTLRESSVDSPQNIAVMEQPPTPISDENSRSCSAQSNSSLNTRSISDNEEGNAFEIRTSTNNSLNQLSGDDCFTLANPNALGTPPTTPPELKVSSDLIIGNRQINAELHSTNPELLDFMDINDPNIKFRGRLSSSSSVHSSSSSTSSSSTNGSYKIHAKDDGGEPEVHKSVTDEKSKIPRLKK